MSQKIALVCDWLTTPGGAERVLEAFHRMYPEAPIYTSQYDPKGIDWFKDADVRTGSLQKYSPKLRKFLAPLRQKYFSNLDLSDYDLIISVTGAEAKGVKKGKARHICYCHVPTQYYWQLYDDYVKNPGFGKLNFLVRPAFKSLVGSLRKKDYQDAQKPDEYITISKYAAEQIKKYYHRDATVIVPPVRVEKFSSVKDGKREGFINASRQVNWKRLDLAIEACLENKESLTLIGDGPEHEKLVKLAGGSPLIKFKKPVGRPELSKYLANSKGYIFPSLEPFGIAPVEALAAGCPVIAYGEGGALDYIKDGKNGVLFSKQNATSLCEAMKKFEKMKFDSETVRKSAEPFSEKNFEKKIKEFIDGKKAK